MASKLGDKLYHTACLASALWAALFAAMHSARTGAGPYIVALIGSSIIYLIGRALRHVFGSSENQADPDFETDE